MMSSAACILFLLAPVVAQLPQQDGRIYTNAPTVASRQLAAGRTLSRRLTMSKDMQDALVKKHNDLRAAVDKPCTASDMESLSWDDSLASASAAWGDKCIWAHDTANGANGWGENLAMRWTSDGNNDYDASVLTNFVQSWYDEIEDTEWSSDMSTVASKVYADPQNQCKSPDGNTGKCMIGHYTAVVWASSSKVGCSAHKCSSGLNGNGGVLLVCKYTPAGNMASSTGSGLIAPWTVGATCASCTSACTGGLCAAGSPSRCRDAITTMTFNGEAYTDCPALIEGTEKFGKNYWCSQGEQSNQICQLTCGKCTVPALIGADHCGKDGTQAVDNGASPSASTTTTTTAMSGTVTTTTMQAVATTTKTKHDEHDDHDDHDHDDHQDKGPGAAVTTTTTTTAVAATTTTTSGSGQGASSPTPAPPPTSIVAGDVSKSGRQAWLSVAAVLPLSLSLSVAASRSF